jgi:hypothetical protein
MSPQEVAGLQTLAVKHGKSMTINPHTGLPEAFSLKSLVPVLAGAALGPAGFGIFETALGAASAVGGLSALSSGSLSKGLMDGLSAYGGSNLASGFAGVGANAAANAELANLEPNASTEAAMSASKNAIAEATKNPFSTIGSGISQSVSDPSKLVNAMGGLGNAAGAGFAVAAPLLADQATPTVTKMPSNGYIRNFDYDPMTQRARALDPVKVSSLGYADGGTIGSPTTVTQMPGNTMTGASRAAFDYLTGASNSTNPQPIDLGGQTVVAPVATNTNTDLNTGRYVWDAASKSYKWVEKATPTTPTTLPPVTVDTTPFNIDVGGGDSVSTGPSTSTTSDSGPSTSTTSDSGPSTSTTSDSGPSTSTTSDSGPSTSTTSDSGPSTSDSGPSSDGSAAASDGGAAAGDGGAASDARGGFYNHGKFDQRPQGIERLAHGGMAMYAQGGLGQLGGYSDGGQLLKGPGDGVSDSIPATIGHKQPARLADGEFVVPARIVSELGNGSTEAGARKLYQMMDRIQAARSKTVGKGRVAKNSRADKYLPG